MHKSDVRTWLLSRVCCYVFFPFSIAKCLTPKRASRPTLPQLHADRCDSILGTAPGGLVSLFSCFCRVHVLLASRETCVPIWHVDQVNCCGVSCTFAADSLYWISLTFFMHEVDLFLCIPPSPSVSNCPQQFDEILF